jgi:hypothetical protein
LVLNWVIPGLKPMERSRFLCVSTAAGIVFPRQPWQLRELRAANGIHVSRSLVSETSMNGRHPARDA